MEIASVSNQTSAIQAYSSQRKDRSHPDQSEEITRKEAALAASQSSDHVTLSRESRDIAVQQADKGQRVDESERTGEARAQENEQQDQARLRAASSPHSITQALEAYNRASLV
jgi:hypothetical protein